MFVDLHIHSYFSDGAQTPEQAALLCRDSGVGLAALLAWRGAPLLASLAAGDWLPSLLCLGAAALGLWLLGLGRASPAAPPARPHRPPARPRIRLLSLLLLALVPLTLLVGTCLLQDRKYYFISLLVLLEVLLPTLLRFEGSRPGARTLVVLAVLTALAAGGRAAFFMLPQFKPMAAVAILAGAAFGGQAGFLVGAASMLVSNFFFVQGAWTPWQMAAMGLVGLLAGWLAPWAGRNRLSLCLYGFFSVVLLYGGILNPASVLMFQPNPTWEMIVSSWVLGFPLDLVHGAATAFFLWAGGPALLEKLEQPVIVDAAKLRDPPSELVFHEMWPGNLMPLPSTGRSADAVSGSGREVDLSALMAQQLALDRELLEQRGQQLVSALTPGITVPADASLLGKAVGNLLSNASRYSPEGAEIRVWCGRLEGRPALSVENTGARVSGDALPHLFEAFYREEGSRNRSTGGSGLGLYLVKMILDRHGAVCTIENTEEGVKATVRF